MTHNTRRFGIRCFVGVFLLCGLPPATAAPPDIEAIVQQNEMTVAVILGEKQDTGAEVQSSGCCVDPRGFLLTTAHQVKSVVNLKAKFVDGSGCALKVVRLDVDREIALLQADKPLPKAAAIGNMGELRSGSPLISIAAPNNLDFSTVTGIVSNTNRMYNGHRVVQADLPASPGSSGGPVFDRNGKIVGVIIGKLKDDGWVTVINPVNIAYDMLRAEGIAVPESAGVQSPGEPASDPNEAEIIPVQGLDTVELAAIRAYNSGVAAGTPEEKVAAYSEAVKLLPAFYEACFNLAVAHTQAKDSAKAEEAYQKAAALRPDAPEVQRNLGRIYLATKRTDEAIRCFQAAVRTAQADAGAHNDLAEAFRAAGKPDLAEGGYKKAIELKPDYAAAHYNLGLLYGNTNRAAEAAACFRRYLECAPGAGDADEVKKWIGELEQAGSKK